MSDYYILDGHTAVACDDLLEGAAWMQDADRTVKKTDMGDKGEVSTVFLGLNHQFGKGSSMLFETLVFGGPLADEMERYSTWEEAESGHDRMVERVKTEESKP